MNFKHNKKRNTIILYEALIIELTKSFLEEKKDKSKKIINVIKNIFNKKTLLSKELELYKVIYESHEMERKMAERLLNEVWKVYLSLNGEEIKQEQNKAISKIHKEVGKSTFENYIPNYRNYATIWQLFNTKMNPKTKIILEERVLNFMCKKKEKENKVKENFLDDLTFKCFVKNFNNEYNKELLKEQKELLNYYINFNEQNDIEFKLFLNEEIGRLKEVIKNSLKEEKCILEDEEMNKKTNEVLNILNEMKNVENVYDINMLEQILKIQQLTQELNSRDAS